MAGTKNILLTESLNRQILSLLIIILATTASAVTNAQEDTNKNTFTVITLSDIQFDTLFYKTNNKAQLLELRNGRRSKPHPAPTSESFEIFTKSEDAKDPENPYQLIGKTQIVRSQKALYFLREETSEANDALPLQIYGIDDSKSIFPVSSFRFINFTNAPLTILFNEDQHLIRPKSETISKVNLTSTGSFTPFILKDIDGKILGGTRLFSHAGNRELVLIFPPKKGRKRLDIRYFSD